LLESLAPEPEFAPLAGTLDGVSLTGKPIELAAGIHRLQCAPESQPAIVWLGPGLERIPRMSGVDHRDLFLSWY
jgi:hypothetical protein